MKKIFLLLFFSFFLNVYAQEEDSDYDEDSQVQNTVYKRDTAKNELSLNVFNVIIFGAFDARYERILNEDSSIGFDVFVKLLKDDNDDFDPDEVYNKDYAFIGRYKYFLSADIARGFYVQGFAMFSGGEVYVDDYYENNGYIDYREREENFVDVSLGFGVGGKFVSEGGFFLDLSSGLGRNFFHPDSPEVVLLMNVDLGFRF